MACLTQFNKRSKGHEGINGTLRTFFTVVTSVQYKAKSAEAFETKKKKKILIEEIGNKISWREGVINRT